MRHLVAKFMDEFLNINKTHRGATAFIQYTQKKKQNHYKFNENLYTLRINGYTGIHVGSVA